jgi:hypothetical protein
LGERGGESGIWKAQVSTVKPEGGNFGFDRQLWAS